LLATCFWQFRASIENFQVAMIPEEVMALFASRLTNYAELHHVLQSLRHSGRREGELLGCRRDGDDRFALKVLVNAQSGCSGAAKLLDLAAILFERASISFDVSAAYWAVSFTPIRKNSSQVS
jgi:hypothetical protein